MNQNQYWPKLAVYTLTLKYFVCSYCSFLKCEDGLLCGWERERSVCGCMYEKFVTAQLSPHKWRCDAISFKHFVVTSFFFLTSFGSILCGMFCLKDYERNQLPRLPLPFLTFMTLTLQWLKRPNCIHFDCVRRFWLHDVYQNRKLLLLC